MGAMYRVKSYTVCCFIIAIDEEGTYLTKKKVFHYDSYGDNYTI